MLQQKVSNLSSRLPAIAVRLSARSLARSRERKRRRRRRERESAGESGRRRRTIHGLLLVDENYRNSSIHPLHSILNAPKLRVCYHGFVLIHPPRGTQHTRYTKKKRQTAHCNALVLHCAFHLELLFAEQRWRSFYRFQILSDFRLNSCCFPAQIHVRKKIANLIPTSPSRRRRRRRRRCIEEEEETEEASKAKAKATKHYASAS